MSSLLSQSSRLIAFVRVVEAGSFSAAARQLGTTPSAISKGIARLEKQLNVTLFRRSTRTLSLTPDGHLFFERVAPLLRALEDSGDAIRPTGSVRGHLRVSLPSELGRLLLPAIGASFLVEHPDLEVDLNLQDHHVDLITEGYDVIFRVGALGDSNLRARTLARMDMVLVASPGLLQGQGHPQTVADLRLLPFVRYQLGGRTLPIVFASGETLLPKGRIGLDSGFGLRTAALDGMGVAYLMRCIVQQDLQEGRLVQLLPDQTLPALELHAVHGFGVNTPIRVKLFTDFVQQEVVRLSSSGAHLGA